MNLFHGTGYEGARLLGALVHCGDRLWEPTLSEESFVREVDQDDGLIP